MLNVYANTGYNAIKNSKLLHFEMVTRSNLAPQLKVQNIYSVKTWSVLNKNCLPNKILGQNL